MCENQARGRDGACGGRAWGDREGVRRWGGGGEGGGRDRELSLKEEGAFAEFW